MMLYKSCPKCRGDLGIERDVYGGPPDLSCIQCGYIVKPHDQVSLVDKLMGRRQQPAVVYATVPPQRRAS